MRKLISPFPSQLCILHLQVFLSFQSFHLFFFSPFSLPYGELPLFPDSHTALTPRLHSLHCSSVLHPLFSELHFSSFLLYLLILLELKFPSHQISASFCIVATYLFYELAANRIHFKLLFPRIWNVFLHWYQSDSWALNRWPVFLFGGIKHHLFVLEIQKFNNDGSECRCFFFIIKVKFWQFSSRPSPSPPLNSVISSQITTWLSLLQPHWRPLSANMPEGLFTGYSFDIESSSLRYLLGSLPYLLRTLFKCHFLKWQSVLTVPFKIVIPLIQALLILLFCFYFLHSYLSLNCILSKKYVQTRTYMCVCMYMYIGLSLYMCMFMYVCIYLY